MAEVRIYYPAQLDKDEWRDLQVVDREGLKSTLNRSAEEIDVLVGWNDPILFYNSHVDPNSEVGHRYNANQSYTSARVAVATSTSESKPLGFAYTADNVSWSLRSKLHLPPKALGIDLTFIDRREEQRKLEGTEKRYLWYRETAVRPEYQRQGIAIQMGRALLQEADELQPVSTYIWPTEIPFLPKLLRRIGFAKTGESEQKIFGEHSPAVKQERYQATTVQSILRNLR